MSRKHATCCQAELQFKTSLWCGGRRSAAGDETGACRMTGDAGAGRRVWAGPEGGWHSKCYHEAG